MSASSKKKLRNEQEAAKLTERQLAEQKEAKKTKLYTIAFIIVLVALIAIAVTVGVNQTISNSGIREKNTVAMTIGEHELSNADLNYFYIDSLNTFYTQNGTYATLFGLDVTQPLNQQVMDAATGETWADYFLESAKNTATAVYSVYDAAQASGFTMSEDDQATVDSTLSTMNLYASLYGYADTESYLKAMYGPGATEESYQEYIEKSLTADAFQASYNESLTYEDADLRAAEAENYHMFSSFTYNYYYLGSTLFLEGGTEDEDGNITYSDEEKAAALAAAEEAAKSLTGEEITSAADLDAAIAALSVNAESATAASTRYEDQAYGLTNAVISQWLSEEGRKEGDLAYLENAVANDDGTETVNGYYVVRFDSVNENQFPLKNVRHILVSFTGGTTDELGNTTYSDEEKATAKSSAEDILAEFQAGDATEESFATLATLKSTDTGSTEAGGLYENVYPGQMVTAFEDWCFDESRKAGDTGIVETEYGYHVMYFVGDSDVTYRDFQIRNELMTADTNEWYNNIVGNAVVTEGDTKYLSLDMVIGG